MRRVTTRECMGECEERRVARIGHWRVCEEGDYEGGMVECECH